MTLLRRRGPTLCTTSRKETEIDKISRLAEESVLLSKNYEAETFFAKLMTLDPKNVKSWFQYAMFNLQRGEWSKAEQNIAAALTYDPENRSFYLIQSCVLLMQGKGKEALVYLTTILETDPFNSLANALSSYTYDFVVVNKELANKYFAICQRIAKRKLGKMPGIGEYRESTETPTPKEDEQPPEVKYQIQPKDAAGKKKSKDDIEREIEGLKAAEQKKIDDEKQLEVDAIWMELIDFLAEYHLHGVATKVLERVGDKESLKYQFLKSKMSFLSGRKRRSQHAHQPANK